MTLDELMELIERLVKLGEGQNERIDKLLRIAESHERRIERLEVRQWPK